MKTALSVYEQRIAPVFDTAKDVLIIDGDPGTSSKKVVGRIEDADIRGKIRWLLDNEVGTLVCGAISMSFQAALTDSGISVVGFVCGDVEEIFQALSERDIDRLAFTMPGCCGRRQGCHGRGRGGGGARRGRCHEGRQS